MRNRITQNGITVQAVAGTSVVLLGMNATKTARKGLLGFAIRREDKTEHERYWLRGMKTFRELIPHPVPAHTYCLLEHPVQTFRWADYTAKQNHHYIYEVVPMYGRPKYLLRGAPVIVEIHTEKEGVLGNTHDVYFNRGAAASQAYAVRFDNIPPDSLPEPRRTEALEWLSRGLEEALLRFIERARDARYALRLAVYEFNYEPVLQALRAAHERGCSVQIVYDARKDVLRRSTEQALAGAGIQDLAIARSETRSYIAHNKFIVLLKDDKPIQVWTGSTNLTRGGIFGQSNVGHICRNARIARAYHAYWQQLAEDPKAGDLRTWIESHTPDPEQAPAAQSIAAYFSPRHSLDLLQWYAKRMNEAQQSAHMTAAFGVHPLFEQVLGKQKAHLRYVLQERVDNNQAQWTVDRDVKVATGGKLSEDNLYGWTKEVLTGFNTYVQYIHDKFILIDPLSEDPVVITGSANFSDAAISKNDENTLVIRGDQRVADIYLGEFMRLFSHYYFRDLAQMQAAATISDPRAIFLVPDDSWTRRYFQRYSVKSKERVLYSGTD